MSTPKSSFSHIHEQLQKTSDDTLSLVHGKQQQNVVTAANDKNALQHQQQQQKHELKEGHQRHMHENVTHGMIISSTFVTPSSSSPQLPYNNNKGKNKLSQQHQYRQYHIHHYYHIHHHHHHHHHHYNNTTNTTTTPVSVAANHANTTSNTTAESASSASISTFNLNSNTQASSSRTPTEEAAVDKLMPIYTPSNLIDPIKTLPPILITESAIISNSSNNDKYATEEVDSLLDTIIMDDKDDFEITRTKVTDITRNMQKYHVNELEDLNQQQQHLIEKHYSTPPPMIKISSADSITKRQSDSGRPLSPLSVLCPTTNSLIQTRLLLEQEPNASIMSQMDNNQSEEQQDEVEGEVEEEEEEEHEEWRNDFLNLMSTVITYSESLETISIELLRTEGKVRELILLQKSLVEQFDEREKMFTSRLNEIEETSQQQIHLIGQLAELDQDLDLKAEGKKKSKDNRRSVLTNHTASTSHTNYGWQSLEYNQLQQQQLLNSNCSIYSNSKTTIDSQYLVTQQQQQQPSSSSQIDRMKDIVHKLRWEVGLRIGGGIGTGHIIHSFQSPFHHGLELIIAGSGTISSSLSLEEDQEEEESYHYHSNNIQSSIRQLDFYRYNYMIHINQDRKSKFKLIPKSLWTPDDQVTQCQFKTCITIFNFLQRRHHCRRCGQVICQRHSLNRLPLFKSSEGSTADNNMSAMRSNNRATAANNNWYRVCDACFYDLIIVNNNSKK